MILFGRNGFQTLSPLIFIVVMLLGFVFIGCAKLQYLEQALTLKDFATNKDEQRTYVEERNRAFDDLLLAVNNGDINQYKNQQSIQRVFGNPLLKKSVIYQDQQASRWLYRYQTGAFTSPKVYLIFNNQGGLEEWNLVATPQLDEE